jgi:hypothetical protein
LAELDEVVHEHVGGAHGFLERAVGRRDGGRQGPAVHPVVGVAGSFFEAVPVGSVRVRGVCSVGKVRDCLGHGAEGRRGLHPAHGAGHRDGNQLVFAVVDWQDDGEARAVVSPEEHAVKAVLNVVFAHVGWPEGRVGVARAVEEAAEGAAKLHGLRGSVWQGSLVDGVPGVVA